MKITGYTIIFTILGILLFIGIVFGEIWMYDNLFKKNIVNNDKRFLFYFINFIILLIITAILDINFNISNKLDKILKKRIL